QTALVRAAAVRHGAVHRRRGDGRAMRRQGSALLIVACLAAGCSSRVVNVAPLPPTEYSEVGPARGEACGLLLFSMVPMSVNDRVARAYARALPGVMGPSLPETGL